MNEPLQNPETPLPPAASGFSRRRFLGASGKKALYLTPVVLTLTAQEAAASGMKCGSAYVHTVGSPCVTEGDGKQCCPTDPAGNPLECHTHQDNVQMTCEPPGSLL